MNNTVQEAMKLAYQWEALTYRAVKEGLEYQQPLDLEGLLVPATQNELELGKWLDDAGISRPVLPNTTWQDVLIELSKEHPGVQALAEAAMLDASLEPLAHQLRASSLTYREISLNALAKIKA